MRRSALCLRGVVASPIQGMFLDTKRGRFERREYHENHECGNLRFMPLLFESLNRYGCFQKKRYPKMDGL